MAEPKPASKPDEVVEETVSEQQEINKTVSEQHEINKTAVIIGGVAVVALLFIALR